MAEQTSPIVVDLGKVRQSRIKRLKKGKGPLMDEVEEVLAQVTEELGEQAEGKTLVPVVILYRRKVRKSRKSLLPLL